MRKPIVSFVILVLIFSNIKVLAQRVDDWEARPTLFVKHMMENGLSFEFKYEHRLDQNFTHYKKSEIGFKPEYKIELSPSLMLKPGVDYRFGMGSNGIGHDLRYFVNLGYIISNEFTLIYKPAFQQQFGRDASNKNFLRNYFEAAYDWRDWSVFIFTENYQQLNGGLRFESQKYGLGSQYEINNRNAIELKLDVKHYDDNKNIVRLMLAYIYTIQ